MQTTPDFSRQAPRGARVQSGSQTRSAARSTTETRPKLQSAERERLSDGQPGESPRYGAGF